MGLTLTIDDFDNSAFEQDWRTETARILRKAAKDIEDGKDEGPLKDHNGNTVGRFDLDPKVELTTYTVTYYEADDHEMDNQLKFQCEAEDEEHAEEQCANAYPGCMTTSIEEGSR